MLFFNTVSCSVLEDEEEEQGNNTEENTNTEDKNSEDKEVTAAFEYLNAVRQNPSAYSKEIGVLDLLAEKSKCFGSKGEVRRTIKENGLSINQEKVSDPELKIDSSFLLDEKYVLVKKGKKNRFILKAE